MLLLATLLIAVGIVVALLGAKLFKLLLPLIGLVTGAMVGFIGVQSVFGAGVVSTAIAIVTAVIVGLLFAVLSFAFFDLAVIVYVAMLGAAAFSYVGVALGLNQDGFLVFMLALAGLLITATWASRRGVSLHVVMLLASFIGVAYVLVGVMLVAGNVTLDQLNDKGVGATLISVVDQSFLWFLVWVGTSLVAWQLQQRLFVSSLLETQFEYNDKGRK